MTAQTATASSSKLSRLAARVLEVVEGNTAGTVPPFPGRPHVALDQLQTDAAISVLKLVGIQYVPRGLQELLKNMDAVSAIRGIFQVLRLNFEQHLHTEADPSKVYAAFAALEEADSLTEETGLDDFPVYEAIAHHEQGRIQDVLGRLRLATLLNRELETTPANFQKHYARAAAAGRKAVINWERLERQRFLQLDELLREWRAESGEFDSLVRDFEQKEALAAEKLCGRKDIALNELHSRFVSARSQNLAPKNAIALLSSCSRDLDELQRSELKDVEATVGGSQMGTLDYMSGADTRLGGLWEDSFIYLFAAAVAAIFLVCLGTWLDHERRKEILIFDPLVPTDSNLSPTTDVSPNNH